MLGPGLVDEDQAGRINSVLVFAPLCPPARDIGTVLIEGENGFL